VASVTHPLAALSEALFASRCSPPTPPDAGLIAAAVNSAVQRFGPRGCTALMAQQFGDRLFEHQRDSWLSGFLRRVPRTGGDPDWGAKGI